jgi:hypothetical protein
MSNSRVPLRGEGPSKLPRALHVVAEERIAVADNGTPLSAFADLSARPEWKLACRVAASKGICKSELLPKFLLYVCEQQLLGKAHEISEQRIGTQIFNRPRDYNPGEDNIVRSYARTLRKRLDEFFEGEGSTEPLRIVIPRGGYVPAFHPSADGQPAPSETSIPAPVVAVAAAAVAASTTPATPEKAPVLRWRPAWLSIALGLVLGVLFAWTCQIIRPPVAPPQGPSHAVWAQLFQQNRNTLIVPTDSGLGILENLTGRLIGVDEYASETYLATLKAPPGISEENFDDLLRQRYTSVVALNITSRLTLLPEFIANRSEVRYARSISTEDLKHSNVILLGSSHTNPWVSLFEGRMNFVLQYTPQVDESFVLNRRPTAREQKIYRNGTDATANHTYGVIDYLPNLGHSGHVLIIQGLNMAATQAASEILFNAEAMKPVLQQAALPNGTLKPFELLVETSSIAATAPEAEIIATRFYP